MGNNCYINGMGAIAGQKLNGEDFLNNTIDYSDQIQIRSLKDELAAYISPRESRRMSTGIKNSIVASKVCLEEAGIEKPEAIITGTGLGCLRDSESFLTKLIRDNELYLTPTSFVQSSHNTVGGQIALLLDCKDYNFTYVNGANSFQSSLFDGMLQIKSNEKSTVLIGGIDEIDEYVAELYQAVGFYKKNDEHGPIYGEGAAFYLLADTRTSSTYAEVVDVVMKNRLEKQNVEDFVKNFLAINELEANEIDVVILGNSGDMNYDSYYDTLPTIFSAAHILHFKHLFGEYLTSSALAFGIGAKLLKTQSIPKALVESTGESVDGKIKNVLIYNQFRGRDHSLMLLKNV